ncbi:MAG TPA: hypothetical protein PLR32_04255 [candidate division Zixibacteria bacterium]|nr:hypothetical protein [candidate division Zixibacteria bacterium]MDM7972551.1 hypothetical protein [candidate division Zixibacteria bacterium]HOD65663.1 hypothetical protein [candidate division Zixibacteria bacterium]HOZ07931.1 hypothetical protein [candidate division Zixibacteria bacterium]HPI32506.1 hypothetical protein [candidate division Zixibacteria bacterium]
MSRAGKARFRPLILLLAAAALAGGCKEDRQALAPPEVYTGMMVMEPDFASGPMEIYPDSTMVTFTVEGTLYELLLEDETDFHLCHTRGTVRSFGTNALTLAPTGTFGAGNCDSIRVPRGELPTVFRGDSLFIGPKDIAYEIHINNTTVTDIMRYTFRLRRVQ